MQELIRYWGTEYDFRRFEQRLNALPQFITEIDGLDIHFIHVRSPHENALPLIITHGWPGSVVEFWDIIGPLTDPAAHGGDPADAFHVVAPSLPGFGFSTPLRATGWESARTARAWVELMGRLGYPRYGAHGGDIGAGISGDLSGLDPDRVVGAHVNTDPTALALLDFLPAELDGLSEAEAASHQRLRQYGEGGKGYLQIQGTRPQTLAYDLTDSPAGQLAWIAQSFKEWTAAGAALPEDAVDRDLLLANVSIYWFTRSGASAARFIYETAHAAADWGGADQDGDGPAADWGAPADPVPQGLALFGGDDLLRKVLDPDRRMAHWTEYDRGGHFAALEVPDLLVGDLRTFFRELR
jgi:pimeloyl-ACP methyl ester carboxylesterase